MKISNGTDPKQLAKAIASTLKASDKVELQVIGAGALNQAVKAVAIARGLVITTGVDLICIPFFENTTETKYKEKLTAITLMVEKR